MPPYGRQAVNITPVSSHHSREKLMYFLRGNKHRTFAVLKKEWGLIDSNQDSWELTAVRNIFFLSTYRYYLYLKG